MLKLLLVLLLTCKTYGLDIRVGHMSSSYDIDKRIMQVCMDIAKEQIRRDINESLNIEFVYGKRGREPDGDRSIRGQNMHLAIREFDRLYFKEKVHVTMGPYDENDFELVGKSAASRDHLVLTARCEDEEFDLIEYYSTLARFPIDAIQMADVLIAVIRQFGWHKVGYVWDHGASDLSGILEREDDIDVDRTRARDGLNDEVYDDIRDNRRVVIVSFAEFQTYMDFVVQAHARDMTGPEYVYIMLWFEPSLRPMPWDTHNKNGPLLRELFSRVLVILPTGYSEDKFNLWLNTLSSITEPIYNITAEDLKPHAVNLAIQHDSLYMYALALNECASASNNSCDINSGSQMLNVLSKMSIENGASGAVRFSEDGDRLSDYNIQTFSGGRWVVNKVSRQLMNGGVTLEDKIDIQWGTANGKPPPDIPHCGFVGELCIELEDNTLEMIVSIIFVAVVVCGSILLYIDQRKKRFEAEILAKSWMICNDELQSMGHVGRFSLRSLRSLPSSGNVSTANLSQSSVLGDIEQQAIWRGSMVTANQMNTIHKFDINKREDLLLLKEMKELQCENLNTFIGICMAKNNIKIVWKYCHKESLDILAHNDEISLDSIFCSSILQDVIRGLSYLHKSKIGCHGQLNIRNCMVDNRWTIKLSGFGVYKVLAPLVQNGTLELPSCMKLSKTELSELAPELLREYTTSLGILSVEGNPETDIYAFGMIMYQVIFRESAFASNPLDQDDIITNLKNKTHGSKPLRPSVPEKHVFKQNLIDLMTQCWNEDPSQRPSIQDVKTTISASLPAKLNVVEHAIAMMEVYARNLEGMVESRTKELVEERQRADELLNKMLPKPIAEQLKRGIYVEPETYASVTIMFTDIVGFTTICSKSTPIQVVAMMNGFYSLFDNFCDKFDVYKVETIGDAYMVASGLPIRNGEGHVIEIASLALEFRQKIKHHIVEHINEHLQIRFGIHSGPVAAGVVGLSMPRYCLFGDTVNTAARMESHGEPMKIHVSEDTKILLEGYVGKHELMLQSRGVIDVKGKGPLHTFWLDKSGEAI